MQTEQLYLKDSYLRSFEGRVIALDPPRRAVALDRSAFYPTGGGQPHDTGALGCFEVTEVTKSQGLVWHTLGGEGLPELGEVLSGELDWERRHALMRTHTALHVLCGVIWNVWGVPVTGGNMEPLSARMDFEFDPLPQGFGPQVEALVNAELEADRPVRVSFIPRSQAVLDESLIRTKISLVPDSVSEIRVVDIVGLDRQADGGTHVAHTGEVGRVKVSKTESKGKGFKRIRLEVTDAS